MDDGGLPAMASTALAELRKTAHLEGAAIIDMTRPDAASVLLFDAAPGVPDAIGSAHQMLRRSPMRHPIRLDPTSAPFWSRRGFCIPIAALAWRFGGRPAPPGGMNAIRNSRRRWRA